MPSTIDRFVDERAARWQRLAALVRRGRREPRALASEEVLELGRLYRAASSDLAIAQRDYPHDRATAALNGLVAEAHALVYSEPQVSSRALLDFVRRDYPRVVRANLRYVAAAFALFAVPLVVSYLLGRTSPDLLQATLPEDLRSSLERRHLWTNIEAQIRPFAASAIMTNNIVVSVLVFAGGATAGVFTAFVLVQNGVFMGSVLAATQEAGLAGDLLTFVASHGFVELSVIFLAGGAGLRLASAILDPGELSRRDALQLRGAQALRMVLGCGFFLAVAGLIEGFISPSDLAWPAKLAVGLASGAGLWGYLLFAGRR
jgi:uncharacterized membrane protein SpoIIM required for sporulation